MNEEEVIESFSALGQDHLFECWTDWDEHKKSILLEELAALDLRLLSSLQKCLLEKQVPPSFSPITYLSRDDIIKMGKERELGRELISGGKAAFLTVAGGQGSRLGFKGPKGLFPISPIQKHSLLQLFAEKIMAAEIHYQVPLVWYIMTSPANHPEIANYFRKHNFFGLAEERVSFFSQKLNPSLSPSGKLLLNPAGTLLKNPDGHGGVIRALVQDGLLADMLKQGIEELFYFQVDNPLVNIPDPLFLGVHRSMGAEISSKVISKISADEKLGSIGLLNGRAGIIEYTDLNEESRCLRDKDGNLSFSQGSIAVHLFNVAFLARADFVLPFHQARKKQAALIPGSNGCILKEVEVVKFEKFIFDIIPLAGKVIFYETLRADEFAPLKNKSGVDSIATCSRGYIEKYALWLEECGVQVPRDEEGRSIYPVEISPLYALNKEILKKKSSHTVNRIDGQALFI